LLASSLLNVIKQTDNNFILGNFLKNSVFGIWFLQYLVVLDVLFGIGNTKTYMLYFAKDICRILFKISSFRGA